jgi:hypothetical protein
MRRIMPGANDLPGALVASGTVFGAKIALATENPSCLHDGLE